MKKGTLRNPKTLDLAERMSPDSPNIAWAGGVLVALWEFVAEYCPEGDVGKFTDRYIERACYWTGQNGTLIEALIGARWIDRSEGLRLWIHDWPEHCEDSVHREIARKRTTFADGTIPNLSRLPSKEREECEKFYMELRSSAHQTCAPNVRTKRAHQTCAPTDTDTDTDTDTKPIPIPIIGDSASEKSESGSPPKLPPEVKCALKELTDRALVFFGKEPPEKRKAWGKWLFRHWGIFVQHGGELSDVRDLVLRIENDSNPKTAQAKGNAVMRHPDRIFAKDTTALLKKRTLRWSEYPKSEEQEP
jgi:hypothetical protein